MPLVTLTLLEGKSAEHKKALADGVHAALVGSGVPAADRFQRFIELKPENLLFDRTYPDLAEPRTDAVVFIEILLSVGRSVKVKRQILQDIVRNLTAAPGLHPNDIFIVFKETQWENWSFAGGGQMHV